VPTSWELNGRDAIALQVKKTNIFEGNSPFAVNDVYSRAAQLGRTGHTSNYWNRRNPNEARKKKR